MGNLVVVYCFNVQFQQTNPQIWPNPGQNIIGNGHAGGFIHLIIQLFQGAGRIVRIKVNVAFIQDIFKSTSYALRIFIGQIKRIHLDQQAGAGWHDAGDCIFICPKQAGNEENGANDNNRNQSQGRNAADNEHAIAAAWCCWTIGHLSLFSHLLPSMNGKKNLSFIRFVY